MQDKQEAVLAVLEQLDPDNAAHWTGQGLPQMDAVNAHFEKGEEVTRKEIHEISPGFCRDVARAAKKERGKKAAEEAKEEEVAEEAAAEISEAKAAHLIAELEPVVEREKTGYDLYQERITALEAVALANKKQMAQLQADTAEVERKVAKLIEDRDREYPAKSQAEAIKEYQQQQFEQRLLKAKALEELRKQHGSPMRAPIDNAMRRAGGFGHKRPNYGQKVK